MCEKTYTDLLTVIPKDVDMTDYCGSSGKYRNWEDGVATPALKDLGYTDIVWTTGEQDSWGPLSRIATAVKDETVHRFIYG